LEWEKLLRNAVHDGKIKELYLRKIPVLKNCENWKNVEPLGYVDHKGKYAIYKGMLVKLKDNLFFVNEKTIAALSQYINWKKTNKITVYTDEQ